MEKEIAIRPIPSISLISMSSAVLSMILKTVHNLGNENKLVVFCLKS